MSDSIRVKYLIKESGSRGGIIKNQASDVYIDGYYPAYSASGQDVWLPVYHCSETGIVVSAVGARCGKTFLATGKYGLCANTHLLILDTTKCFAPFVQYALNNEDWWLKGGSAQPFVKVTESLNQKIYFPNFKTQQSIANFLDQKCSKINSLSSDIQSQIDVLEEYKKSVITEAVTKGLNPEVEMKDSGVEWIGMIPTHWDVHPVYRYFGERKVKNSALKEQNLLSLSYGKIVRKDIEALGGLLPASFNTYNIVEAGDIIIRPTDLQNDKRSLRTGLVTEHGIITSAYIDLMPKANVNSKYFHYLLHSYDVMKVFYNMGNGVRQGLNYSEFAKLMIFAPPIQEQQTIVDYLDAKCTEIDAIIADKKVQLETLAEYKKSLIYEYVTGKKGVE